MNKQSIAMKVRAEYNRYGKSVKWDDIYSSEEELLKELEQISVPQDRTAPANTFRGYEYIYSFAFYLQKGWKLSEKQVKQAKRLALEIKIASAIEED